MKRGGFAFGLAAAVCLWAGAATALSFTMADVAFTVGGASGTIQLVGGSQDAGGTGTTLSGAPAAGDDILIFRVVMSSGSVVEVGAGIFLNFSTGSGTVAGADVNVLNGAFTSTGASLRTFSFDTDGNTSADSLSGTSDSFWVTWASVADGAQVSFMINNGTTQQTFLGTVNVPEPGGLLLVALGVGALAATRRLRG
jgi:hypothetical protein